MLALLTSRWAAYAGAVGLVAVLLWGIHHHGYAAGVEDERAKATAALAEAGRRYAAQVVADARTNQEAVRAYETEIEGLRRAAVPVGPVRLCVGSSGGAVPTGAGDPAGARRAAAAAGSVPGVPDGTAQGPDIGPGLQLIADRGDRLSAQVRHLLERNRKLSAMAGASGGE